MERLVVGSWDCEVGVLFNKALSLFRESIDRALGPPIREVAILIVVTACAVKGVAELMTSDRTKCTIGHVFWDFDIEDGELHDTRWEDDFITRGVVVGVH